MKHIIIPAIATTLIFMAFFTVPGTAAPMPFRGTPVAVDTTKTERGAFDTQTIHDKQLEIKHLDITDPVELIRISGHLSEIDGGLQLHPSIGLPTCVETLRGLIWFVAAKPGTDDSVVACMKLLDGTFQWKQLSL